MRCISVILLAATALSPAATPQQIAEGRALLHKFNCGACHAELPGGIKGPALHGVGDRLAPAALAVMSTGPASIKRGSRMPRMLAPIRREGEDRGKALARADHESEALTHFLLSLKSPAPLPRAPAGNSKRGEKLYRTVGCAGCHQSFGLAENFEGEPLVLGRAYSHAALVAYLLAPKTAFMPSLKLSRQEAADIAAWLHSHNDPPGPIVEPGPSLSRKLADEGRTIFVSHRCVACHDTPDVDLPGPRAGPAPVKIKNWSAGCLAASPVGSAAVYDLTDQQRTAIRAAAISPVPRAPTEIVDHFLTVYNCSACHERGGKGGPSEKRRPLFTSTGQMAESYGDFGNIPPKLDHLGRKLTREWLRKILVEGHGEVRPYLATRMPHYRIPEDEIERFVTALEQADRRDPPITIDVSGLPGHQRGHYGRDLIGTKGLNCITCHGLKGKRALGAPSIDLTHTAHRLRPAYFKELLLAPQSVQPGTLMPPLFLNRPKAPQEVEQLWTYLKELDQRRLPDGLLRAGDFELKPATEGKPIVLRTFLEKVGTHAIAVGFPQGTHLAFDSRTSQWALAWKGKFLDAMSTWDDRYATPAKPLGESVSRFALGNPQPQFRGYRLTASGIPVFLYEEAGVLIEDQIAPHPDGKLRRTLKRGEQVSHQRLHLHNGKATFRDAD